MMVDKVEDIVEKVVGHIFKVDMDKVVVTQIDKIGRMFELYFGPELVIARRYRDVYLKMWTEIAKKKNYVMQSIELVCGQNL